MSARVRLSEAAARVRAVSRSWAARFQKSPLLVVVWRMAVMKWSAKRKADSQVRVAVRGFHQKVWGWWVMAWGSNR
jgi:hypothetical protein